MIIGICGLIGSGKDTAADYLVNIHGYRRESFASSLKDAVSAIFGWDRVLLEGRTKQSREWREQRDEWWSARLGMDVSPRWVLQHLGTDVIRDHFSPDIWAASVENKLRTSQDDIVISDCRFANEIEGLRRQGGLVVRVRRGPDPGWYAVASIVNAGPEHNNSWARYKTLLDSYNVHASESSWAGTEFDAVIDNDGTLEDLYSKINDLVLSRRPAKVSQVA